MLTILHRQGNFFFRCIALLILTLCAGALNAQQLRLKDFAIWGGSAPATTYNPQQGLFISRLVTVTGSIGSNHLVQSSKELNLTGNLFSANKILISRTNSLTGNVTANNQAGRVDNSFSADKATTIKGDVTVNGKVFIDKGNRTDISSVTGKVYVPAPTNTYYNGPEPVQGYSNTLILPVSPAMPGNTPFDNKVGTLNISTSRIINPGSYGNVTLTAGRVLTFNGPGNYIFNSVNNSNNEIQLMFDFKNTTSGVINLFIVKDANWGKVTVKMLNGNLPTGNLSERIYTEVHGNGASNGGSAFEVSGSATQPTNYLTWAGAVWAPNAGINIGRINGTGTISGINISGALWSATKVNVSANLNLKNVATQVEPNFIAPYYPPPATGKVDETNNKIGSELFSLATNAPLVSIIPDNTTFRILGDKVFIEVIGVNANDLALKAQLQALGMTGFVNNGPYSKITSGYFPINQLTALNAITNIRYVRPLYPPLNNAGQTTTQGDTAMRSDKVRGRFGADGEGVKIGVLSDSYNKKGGAPADVTEGDLPNDVQVVLDFDGKDEGRAMLQIVHDIAPKAKLAYRTGFQTAGDFAQGIADLSSPLLPGGKCDVIVDDITYITEPFLRDGKVAEAVNNAVTSGVTYFSSAGNFGARSYESGYQDAGTNPAIIPAPATLHRFGATNAETYQTLKLKPGSYTIVLQWSDEFFSAGTSTGVQTDLDLYLVGTSGFTLFGFNRSNLTGDPFEVCPFTVTDTTEARLIVVKASGVATNVRFKYIIFRGDGTIFDYQNARPSTIVGHPNADSCIAVGAMLYGNIPPFTPVYPGVASFSSRGGAATLVPGSGSTTYLPRNKPNLVAPNGVNTTVTLGAQPTGFNDGDDYPNFFGTSASAPHAAAVAALLIQARKKYDLQTIVSPFDIRTLMQNTAGNFSTFRDGFDFIGGNGFLRADAAMKSIANARPVISSLGPNVPTETQIKPNGTNSFAVKVKGVYLSNDTKIYFGGNPIETIVSADETEATGIIPPFAISEDPPVQLFNPAKTISGLDGGLSEPLYFFSTKKAVRVKAENASRNYGQANPAFSVKIWIDNVPIENTEITPAALKLDGENVSYATNANPLSIVGLYGIIPSRANALDPANAADATIIKDYTFTFESGTLNVGKMPLKITPNDKTIKYGDYIGEVTYNYEFPTAVPGTEALLNQVEDLHKKYIADNALGVIQGFNQQETFSTTDLANMSAMASFQAVSNSRKFTISNGQLQPLVNVADNAFADQRFLIDIAVQSFANYKANPAQSSMVSSLGEGTSERAVLNLKSLANGVARSSLSNGQLQPIVNGQLMAMVNGQLQAVVNGQLQPMVNGQLLTDVDGNPVYAQDYVFQNGQLRALVNGTWIIITNGQLRAIVNETEYITDLSVTNGQLQAIVNGQLMAIVNGQLQAIVNGQLLAMVNGQLQALVNGQLMPIVNGQLLAMVNGQLQPMVNGQLLALVNGQLMALVNGQLMAIVNGQLESISNLTQLSNGQLQAVVNGQLQAIVNGQLKALVNGIVTDIPTTSISDPLSNGQLQAIVNGQLQAMVNGQLQPLVNGQLQPIVNQLQSVEGLQLINGQLRAIVNGQLLPIVNGQLQAMVNGTMVTIPNTTINLVNGQLQALVNGQLQALVNGQLQALVNGQLQPIVNGDLQPVSVARLSNGQLRAIVNGNNIPLANGQLQAIVNTGLGQTNGQLLAMVNGQLMALVNGVSGEELTFAMIANGQLQALVNGQLQPIVNEGGAIANGQLQAMVNGQLQPLVNATFTNGQLQAIVNNQDISLANGQLLALVNGQLQPMVNNFEVGGTTNNTNTVAIVDDHDITLQGGALGGMFAVNMITGLDVGPQKLVAAAFINDNFDVTYGLGDITITPRPLVVSADSITKVFGAENPELTITAFGFAYEDSEADITLPTASTLVNTDTEVGNYPITLSGGSASNYNIVTAPGIFTVTAVDNEPPVFTCPDNISLNLDESGNAVSIFAKIDDNQIIISSSTVDQNREGGVLSVQNDLTKALSGSCDCPPGHAVVGYEGRVGEIVDQFRLICAPINSDGSPGASASTFCFNGGAESGSLVEPIMAPSGSWMVGFGIGDMIGYFNRSGTLSSIEGYSQTYTDVLNGLSNRFLNTKMGGTFTPQRTTVEYAPPGYVLTGMNYHIDVVEPGPYSSAVQFKYQLLVPTQELARFAVSDNSSDNLTVEISGNTTLTSANVGNDNSITLQVTDASRNSSTCTISLTVTEFDNIAPTAICQPITVNLGSDGTATVTAEQVNNGSTDNSTGPLTYQFLGNNFGQRTVPVNSGTRTERSLTGITYTYNGQQQTLTPANAIRSTIELASLTANPTLLPLPAGDANRFWDISATTMTEASALRVLGDFDLGTALQDCADPVGVNHKVTFDAPITPGAGPEIFIVHGGLAFDIEILDVNGRVALTIPASIINSGSNITIGGSAVSNSFNAFFLRDNKNYAVEFSQGHFNNQNQVLALDINASEVPLIGGIRFGGGTCNYVYEILGYQPPTTTSQIVFTNANVGNDNPVSLQVTDASGNSATCTTDITVTNSEVTSARSSQTTTTKTKVKPTQDVMFKEGIYPNPATSTIRIQLAKEVTSANNITLVDAIGRLQTNISTRQLNSKLFELNISSLPKGVYIVRAKTTEGDQTFKFIKM